MSLASVPFVPGQLVRKKFRLQADPASPNHKHPGPVMNVEAVHSDGQVACSWPVGSEKSPGMQSETFQSQELEPVPEE